MQKSIFLRTNINEASVESWHQFPNLANINVAHSIRGLAGLVLILHQAFVFQQCDGDFFGARINDNFACHVFVLT